MPRIIVFAPRFREDGMGPSPSLSLLFLSNSQTGETKGLSRFHFSGERLQKMLFTGTEREKERERKKGLFSFHIRRRQSTDGPFRLPELGLRRFLKFRFRIQLRFQNIWDSYRILVNPTPGIRQIIQSRALGHFQGFVKSFLGCSTGRWAILQLLCSQARRKLKEELLKKNKQNLQKQPNAGRCSYESCVLV